MNSIINSIYEKYNQSTGISIDSRNLKEGNLFFGISGDNFDGNNFIEESLSNGASFAVTNNKKFKTKDKCVYVENTLECLQNLAAFHRSKLQIPVVGVTGSNGKTTTKELISLVLSLKFNVFSTIGNFNNHIGVPLSVLELNDSHDIAVIEMGASGLGEIAFLCEISQPNLGIITNIAPVHLEGFGNFESVIRGKSELFDYLIKNDGVAFINNNDKVISNFSKRFEKPYLLFGEASFLNCEYLKADPFISFLLKENEIFKTKIIGDYNYENIVSALSIGKYYGVDTKIAAEAICSYEPSENRSQVIEKKNCTIILDAYNANPTSVIKALNNFSNIKGKKIVFLGDMFELGKESKSEHAKLGDILNDFNFDEVYLIGDEIKYAFKNYPSAKYFKNKNEVLKIIKTLNFENSSILFKASRGMQLENIAKEID